MITSGEQRQITLRIPENLRERLKLSANRANLSVNQLAQILIDCGLDTEMTSIRKDDTAVKNTRIIIKDIPPKQVEALNAAAIRNERTLEAHLRFIINKWYEEENLSYIPAELLKVLDESAKQGYRSIHNEIVKRLAESLNTDVCVIENNNQ
ncbi:hypothetical protein IFG57_003977 [Salmonella enterica]|nr:hypothetical protein [Salmonella enterica]